MLHQYHSSLKLLEKLGVATYHPQRLQLPDGPGHPWGLYSHIELIELVRDSFLAVRRFEMQRSASQRQRCEGFESAHCL